jgi:hypothetical protein
MGKTFQPIDWVMKPQTPAPRQPHPKAKTQFGKVYHRGYSAAYGGNQKRETTEDTERTQRLMQSDREGHEEHEGMKGDGLNRVLATASTFFFVTFVSFVVPSARRVICELPDRERRRKHRDRIPWNWMDRFD